MPYVSCQYAPPDPLQAEPKPAGQKAITCTDEQGQVWWLSEDSEVGDWLRFKESGGTVLENKSYSGSDTIVAGAAKKKK